MPLVIEKLAKDFIFKVERATAECRNGDLLCLRRLVKVLHEYLEEFCGTPIARLLGANADKTRLRKSITRRVGIISLHDEILVRHTYGGQTHIKRFMEIFFESELVFRPV